MSYNEGMDDLHGAWKDRLVKEATKITQKYEHKWTEPKVFSWQTLHGCRVPYVWYEVCEICDQYDYFTKAAHGFREYRDKVSTGFLDRRRMERMTNGCNAPPVVPDEYMLDTGIAHYMTDEQVRKFLSWNHGKYYSTQMQEPLPSVCNRAGVPR